MIELLVNEFLHHDYPEDPVLHSLTKWDSIFIDFYSQETLKLQESELQLDLEYQTEELFSISPSEEMI